MKKLFKTLILISLTLGIILSLFIYNISPHSTKKFTTDYFDTNPFTVESATNKTRPINNLDQKENTKQILWGDTHVHTTYSMDAFYMSLPMMHGSRGAFPAAFACDYARFISQLDFYVLTDHAESYIPRTWKDQVDSIRQCNAISGNEDNPDLVAFIGWEWTQAGATPETHYGHHNVIFKDYKEGQIPDRPIAAGGALSNILRTQLADVNRNLFLLDPLNRDYYWSFANYLDAILSTPNCEKGIPSNYLPKDCYETASTPGELYAKLDDWGFDVEVIPHGTTWGFYTPQAATWEEYTSTPDNIRPDYNSLVEIYSGHGNSEVFFDFLEVEIDEEGNTWLVGQYRYALDAYSWEVPMGGGPLELDTLASAKRELKEETGLTASQWTELQLIHTSNSVTDEVGYIFMALGLTEGEPEFEDTEDISIKKLPFVEALEWVMSGKITDSLSVIAIFRVARALGY